MGFESFWKSLWPGGQQFSSLQPATPSDMIGARLAQAAHSGRHDMLAHKVVEFRNVAKTYGRGWFNERITALADVSFHINAGEVFALLGPNRAGKTTLIKVLLGLARPSAGQVHRLGTIVSVRATLARVGYVHEHPGFPRHLTAASLLRYFGALTLVPADIARQRVAELLQLVGLADRARDSVAGFSKGMVQRLALAQALLNDPDLLVLDEPAEGLDVTGRQLVLDVIAERRRRGRSVLLVSHALADVAQVCDRAGVIVAGRLAYLGPLGTLIQSTCGAGGTLEQALRRLYEKSNPAPALAQRS